MPAHRPVEDRLWEKVDFNGPVHPTLGTRCWLWTGVRQNAGHGRIGVAGTTQLLTHRVSWELHHGPIPSGLFVCHRCDIGACVNPEHLFLGTQTDNMRDMAAKGRGVYPALCGEALKHAKLTAKSVRRIRARAAAGESHSALGIQFGVNRATVSYVVARKTWRHIQ